MVKLMEGKFQQGEGDRQCCARSSHDFTWRAQGRLLDEACLRGWFTGRNPAAHVRLYAQREPEHFAGSDSLYLARSSLSYLHGVFLILFSFQEKNEDRSYAKKNQGTDRRTL